MPVIILMIGKLQQGTLLWRDKTYLIHKIGYHFLDEESSESWRTFFMLFWFILLIWATQAKLLHISIFVFFAKIDVASTSIDSSSLCENI